MTHPYDTILFEDLEEDNDNLDIRWDPGLNMVYVNASEQKFLFDGEAGHTNTCIRLTPEQARELAAWLLEVTG